MQSSAQTRGKKSRAAKRSRVQRSHEAESEQGALQLLSTSATSNTDVEINDALVEGSEGDIVVTMPLEGPEEKLQGAASRLAAHLGLTSATDHLKKAVTVVMESDPDLQNHMDRWLEEAQTWMACNMEQEQEIGDLREAMQVSLTEAELRKQEAEAIGIGRGDNALLPFQESPLMILVHQLVCPMLLAKSEAWASFLKLLKLEHQCKRWYKNVGTSAYFIALSEELHTFTSKDVFGMLAEDSHQVEIRMHHAEDSEPGCSYRPNGPVNSNQKTLQHVQKPFLRCSQQSSGVKCSTCGDNNSSAPSKASDVLKYGRSDTCQEGDLSELRTSCRAQPESRRKRKLEEDGLDMEDSISGNISKCTSAENTGLKPKVTERLETQVIGHETCTASLPESTLRALLRLSEFLDEKFVLLQQGIAELNVKGIPAFVPSIFLREDYPGDLQSAEPELVVID